MLIQQHTLHYAIYLFTKLHFNFVVRITYMDGEKKRKYIGAVTTKIDYVITYITLRFGKSWCNCWYLLLPPCTTTTQATCPMYVQNKSLISVMISWLIGWQVWPDQLAAVIWTLWKPTLPNIRILFGMYYKRYAIDESIIMHALW